MSKYEEIAELAGNWSRAIYKNKEDCELFARELMRAYADYLGCPMTNITFRKLDRALEITDDSVDFGKRIPFVLDGNGHWNFCVCIRFEAKDGQAFASELLKLSIKFEGGLITIGGDESFQAKPNTKDAFLPLFDSMSNKSRVDFSSPLIKQSRRIGFT